MSQQLLKCLPHVAIISDGIGSLVFLKTRELVVFILRSLPDSLFGDVPDLDSKKAAEIAKGREKWKSLRTPKRC